MHECPREKRVQGLDPKHLSLLLPWNNEKKKNISRALAKMSTQPQYNQGRNKTEISCECTVQSSQSVSKPGIVAAAAAATASRPTTEVIAGFKGSVSLC